jgi:hypothetical protein
MARSKSAMACWDSPELSVGNTPVYKSSTFRFIHELFLCEMKKAIMPLMWHVMASSQQRQFNENNLASEECTGFCVAWLFPQGQNSACNDLQQANVTDEAASATLSARRREPGKTSFASPGSFLLESRQPVRLNTGRNCCG